MVDPRNEEIFYVGKGSGRRMFQHVVNFRNGQIDNVFKARRIREIMHSGLEVRACVFSRHKHAGGAYAAERLVIESLGDELTNIAHGNVCSDQKCLEWARYRLTTVVPFCHWLKMNPTLANDPIWYWRIVEGIRLLEKKSLERLAA